MIQGIPENEKIKVKSHQLIAFDNVLGDLSANGNWGEFWRQTVVLHGPA
jgi:hypothetical protein